MVRERKKCMSTKRSLSSRGLLFDSVTFGYLLGTAIYFISRPNYESLLNVTLQAGLAFACFTVGAIISMILFKNKIITLGQYIFAPGYLKARRVPKPLIKTFW